MLGRRHVMPSVVQSLNELQVEGTFPTGTYLVTVHYPVSSDDGDLEKALYGSFLPIPPADTFPDINPDDYEPEKMPGAIIPVKDERITLNEGRKRIKLKVTSRGDRPIQVGAYPWIFVGELDSTDRNINDRRSDRTTISSKRTRNCILIASAPMATVLIFPPERRCDSNPATPKP